MLYNQENVRDNVRNREGKRVFYLAKGDQLTSGARDFLSRERIEILPAALARAASYRLLNGASLEEKPEHMSWQQSVWLRLWERSWRWPGG